MHPNEYLENIERIDAVAYQERSDIQKLFLPNDVSVIYSDVTNHVKTNGLGVLDKEKDLIELVKIQDALQGVFEGLNIFSPRPYAESKQNVPPHVTVQGIILSVATNETALDIHELQSKYVYGKHGADEIWIDDLDVTKIQPGEVLMIMNRRVGGWDGSQDRPVIELLGAGGHVGTVWDGSKLISMSPDETIRKEALEELGLDDHKFTTDRLGGFYNSVTNELVLVYAIVVDWNDVSFMQECAYSNFKHNTDGIYMGRFISTMEQYLNDASMFAGGEEAKPTNFPTNRKLMDVIKRKAIDLSKK